MKSKTIIPIAIISSIVIAATVWAMPPEGQRGGGRGEKGGLEMLMRHSKLAEKVGLTEEDIAAIRDLKYREQKETIPLRAALNLARLEERKIMQDESPDKEAVLKAVEVVGQAQIALKKVEVTYKLEMKELVGQETLDKLHECRDKFRRGQKKRQGKRDGKRGKKRGGKKGHRQGPPQEDDNSDDNSSEDESESQAD